MAKTFKKNQVHTRIQRVEKLFINRMSFGKRSNFAKNLTHGKSMGFVIGKRKIALFEKSTCEHLMIN